MYGVNPAIAPLALRPRTRSVPGLAPRPRGRRLGPDRAMGDGQRVSGVLVGREQEMAQLDELVANVLAGAAANVALAGEPGIGKSRLLSELVELATSRRFLVLEGRAAEFEH